MASNFFNPLAVVLKPLLEEAINEDILFAERVLETTQREENKKSFEECCDYIMGEAYTYAKENKQRNFGLAGCDKETLMGMIRHYFDEDEIKITKISGATAKVQAVKGKKDGQEEDIEEENEEAPAPTPKPAPKEKKLTKAQMKRGDDCFALFGDEAFS